MKKVLSIVSNNIESGGVESYLINAYKNIDLKNIKIDLLVPGKIVYTKNAEEFKKLGCDIIQLRMTCGGIKRLFALEKSLKKIMRTNNYDVVHINTGNISIEALALRRAAIEKIPIRIAHSHGTVYIAGKFHESIRFLLRTIINKYATDKLACSKNAAEALFGKEHLNGVVIAKNGIDADKYGFDNRIRDSVRKENGWDDSYVIGSVGRMAPEKNYSFILDVFNALQKNLPLSRLVLIGEGEEKGRLEQKTKELGIYDKVSFMGVRRDVPELLQGFDVFVLASKREALGIVNIEAQATGLPCVISDVIPKEVDLTGLVSFVSLQDGVDAWTKSILHYKELSNRHGWVETVKDKGYDFSTSYDVINKIYNK